MNSIVKRIVFVRNKLNCPVDEFSRIIGYSYGYVKLLEQEKKRPSDELLRKISENFNVSFAWLKDGIGEPGKISCGRIIDTEVSKRFYNLRKERQISMQRLSELTGISPSTIDRIEKNKTKITKRQLEKMAKALSVGYDWLAYGDEDAKEYPLNDEMIEFLKSNPEIRKIIMKKMKNQK